MALRVGTDHHDPEPVEEQEQKEQQLQQPLGDLQHPSGPSATVSSVDGDPHVNGVEARETTSRGSTSSLSSATAQASTPPAAETATATTKREGQRKKGNTWLDIFSFGRWRSSSNRQQGAIQLAQAFGAPNQPGRPGPVIGVFVCKGPRNELQGLVVASPLSLERFSFEGRLLQRAAPPQPLTCCRGGKIGGVGRVLLCGSQAGRVFIVNAETFDLMLELDPKKTPPTSGSQASEPHHSGASASSSGTSSGEGENIKKGAPGSPPGSDEAPEGEVPICSLTINATFAEFAHFVLAGDALGRTFVWQVPSTKLLLVLPPPELTEEQKRQREEAVCCGCCSKLYSKSDETFAAAAKHLLSPSEKNARKHKEEEKRHENPGVIQAVGTVAEVSVAHDDTDDETGANKIPKDGHRDSLASVYDTTPSYQNAQWLGAKPKGKKKKIPAPASEPPPPPQGDQQEQMQQDGGFEGSLFSEDESGDDENERKNHEREKSADSTALLQSEENLPYIQHAPQELLQQLRAETQQRHKQQRHLEKTDHAAFSSRDGTEAEAEAEGNQIAVTSGDILPESASASCSPLGGGIRTPADESGRNCEASEDAGALESIPLSPEACKAPANSPSVPGAGDTEGQPDGASPFVLPAGATCGSSNCCFVKGRAPCGKTQRHGCGALGGPTRYVGAMLPLAALDQLWVGYGDGSLAVFSLSTYQLLHVAQLPDPDISKIEYAKYRDLIIIISANRALSMWCPRTLQCIFEMGAAEVTCSSPLSFLYLLEAPEAWELRSTIILAGCMDGSICVRRLERDLGDGGISCKLVRNYIREVEPQVPISCILVDSWLNAAFVGDASGVVFTLPYVFQLLEAPALINTPDVEA